MVEHVLIPDADRHEPKHASTAIDRQALLSNGDGTTEFSFIDYNDLVNIPAVAGYRQVLYGFSAAASQAPGATNTPIQIEFGAGQVLPDVTLAPDGTITFNTAGDYIAVMFLRFGRTVGGGVAYLFSRILYNDVQIFNSNATKLPDQDSVIPFSASIPFTVTAGATIKLQLMRDSLGINNGGLFQLSPTLGGWNISPSASISIYKYEGNE